MTDKHTMPDVIYAVNEESDFENLTGRYWNFEEDILGINEIIETSYTLTDIHETTKAELERVKQSHAGLLAAIKDLKDAAKGGGYPHTSIKTAEKAIANAEKVVGNDTNSN